MLTTKMLDEMEPGMVFTRGTCTDNPFGANMMNSNRMLRWVAVRGKGCPDWAIYTHFEDEMHWDEVRTNGDKIFSPGHIRHLVECDDEAFKRYRY